MHGDGPVIPSPPPHDGQFCINGLLWPDRTLHPACFEVKAVQVLCTSYAPFCMLRRPEVPGIFEILVPSTVVTVWQAPVAFALLDTTLSQESELSVSLTNKRFFKDTGDLRLHWRLLVDGLVTELALEADPEGWIEIEDVKPIQPQVCPQLYFRIWNPG